MDAYKRDIVDVFQATAEHPCTVQFPYPIDVPLPAVSPPSSFPKTFRWTVDYRKKLKDCKCNAVYAQYTKRMLANTVAEKKANTVRPKFLLPPVNTNITFAQNLPRFKISAPDLAARLGAAKNLPAYFNWAEEKRELTKPASQGMCGSCYSIAVASCLSDMYVTTGQTPTNPDLSAAYLLSCYPQGPDSQCGGGDPVQLVRDVQRSGMADTSCIDYSFCGPTTGCGGNPNLTFDPKSANALIPPCSCAKTSRKYYIAEATALCIPPNLDEFSETERTIIRGYLDHLYGGSDHADLSTLPYREIQDLIKHHIHTQGPVIGGFHVFKNFFADRFVETDDIYVESQSYLGVPGVDYSNLERDWAGSHAVVIVGWGSTTIEKEEVPYWIVRNSWSSFWGNAGYFKMAMYGNDPKKKYQNRVAQFEYPTVLFTNEGIAVTGGVVMIHPGKIEAPRTIVSMRSGASLLAVGLIALGLYLGNRLFLLLGVVLLIGRFG
jgi:hypothetical protein